MLPKKVDDLFMRNEAKKTLSHSVGRVHSSLEGDKKQAQKNES